MKYIKAKDISFSDIKRDKSSVTFIVIHNTGNRNDTAENNALYFANANSRAAGAHFFVDRAGKIVKSINLNRVAWAVGGSLYSDVDQTGGATYFGEATNGNSVSIELCDIVDQYPSRAQIKALKKTIAFIRRRCPNAKKVIRHFDVTGKYCPYYFMDPKRWARLLADLGEV